MRAVKSVLVMAGALKRANPELSEDVVLIRAMRDSNLPKFLVRVVPPHTHTSTHTRAIGFLRLMPLAFSDTSKGSAARLCACLRCKTNDDGSSP